MLNSSFCESYFQLCLFVFAVILLQDQLIKTDEPLTAAKVKKCAGCPFLFRDPMCPPFIGLVIQHKEKDFYHDKTGVLKISSEANIIITTANLHVP